MRANVERGLLASTTSSEDTANGIHSRLTLFDCPIDNVSMNEALGRIEGFIREGTPHQHIAINVHKVVQAHKDPKLLEVVRQSHLSCADGQPLVWLSRLLGKSLKSRITGIDLMTHLLPLAENKQYRVYFLGARPEVVSAVVQHCLCRYPSLQVAGYRDGYWKPDEEPSVVEFLRKAKPDVLFVALGSPQKEFFIHRYLHYLAVPFAMSVGGAFDVIVGKTKRAPEWIQRIGLEWLWRVLQEPRRMWKRYLRDGTVFMYLVFKEFARRLH